MKIKTLSFQVVLTILFSSSQRWTVIFHNHKNFSKIVLFKTHCMRNYGKVVGGTAIFWSKQGRKPPLIIAPPPPGERNKCEMYQLQAPPPIPPSFHPPTHSTTIRWSGAASLWKEKKNRKQRWYGWTFGGRPSHNPPRPEVSLKRGGTVLARKWWKRLDFASKNSETAFDPNRKSNAFMARTEMRWPLDRTYYRYGFRLRPKVIDSEVRTYMYLLQSQGLKLEILDNVCSAIDNLTVVKVNEDNV